MDDACSVDNKCMISRYIVEISFHFLFYPGTGSEVKALKGGHRKQKKNQTGVVTVHYSNQNSIYFNI